MKTKKKKGFTLTELIVVIVIIGVLAAVMIPTLTGYITKAQNSKDETLVASLNRSYENTKIMDDIEIYTAYDVQAFLKEVDMENIEVSNKSNLILFDTIEDKFVLIKDKDNELSSNNLQSNELFVYHISEYYSINHHYFDEELDESDTPAATNLEYSKLSNEHNEDECNGKHRAFIVSTNGNEIAEAVGAFMQINASLLDNTQESKDKYKEIISILTRDYKDVTFKGYLNSLLSRALFIDNIDGVDKCFYINLKNELVVFNGTSPENQKLTRPIVLSNVSELKLEIVKNLEQSTIIVPGTVEKITFPNNGSLATNIELAGNLLDVETNTLTLDDALIIPIVKELLTATSKVSRPDQLKEIIEQYDAITKGTIFTQLTGKISSDKIEYLKKMVEKINKENQIVVINSFKIEEKIEIPNGVELLIPYSSSNVANNSSYDGNSYSSTFVKYHIKDENGNIVYGGKEPYIELTIGENVEITVNGTITVGGITGFAGQGLAGHTSGDYAQLNLSSSTSIINLGSTGSLNVYGYVIGEGQINTVSGSTINEPFVIGDYAGGTNSALLAGSINPKDTDISAINWIDKDMLVLNANEQCAPFSQYGLVNIQTKIKLVYGSSLNGYVKMWMSGDYSTNENIPLPLIGSKDGYFLKLTSGYMIITYQKEEGKIIEISNKDFKNICQTKLDIYGDVETGSISISVPLSSSISVTLNSTDFLLPISFNFAIYMKENSNLSIKTKIAFLPGSELIIEKNSYMEVKKDSQLFIFDKLVATNPDGTTSFSDNRYAYPNDIQAKFIVNGSLQINGVFGGIVQTNEIGAEIITGSSAILDGSTEAKFGSGTQKFSFIVEKPFAYGPTLNNYNLVGMISNGSKLKCLEKNLKYVSKWDNNLIPEYICKDYENEKITSEIADTSIETEKYTYIIEIGQKWTTKVDYVDRTDLKFIGSWDTIYTVKIEGYKDVEIEEGSKIDLNNYRDLNQNPIKDGYKFDGKWYIDSNFETEWDFANDIVKESFTLYPGMKKWCTIKFNLDDGKLNGSSTISDAYVLQGNTISNPGNPTKTKYNHEYTFKYWYYKDGLSKIEWNFDEDIVNDSITLYAKFDW